MAENSGKFVAYYLRQHAQAWQVSVLWLEAQRIHRQELLQRRDGQIVARARNQVESGRNSNRPSWTRRWLWRVFTTQRLVVNRVYRLTRSVGFLPAFWRRA